MRSLAVHVIADDHRRRAQVSRAVRAAGHHAEIYVSEQELVAHMPRDGVVIALDDAIRGGISGLTAVLHQNGRWLGVIAASTSPSIDEAVAAMREGATDYIGLPIDSTRLAQAIGRAADEAARTQPRQAADHDARTRIAALSAREREVLDLVAQGKTNKAIGLELDISPRTVEIHRSNMLIKLGVKVTAAAIRMYLRGVD